MWLRRCLVSLKSCVERAKSTPRALKRGHIFKDLTARLKSGPSQDSLESEFFRNLLKRSPDTNPSFFHSLLKEYNPAFPEVAVKRWIALLAIICSSLCSSSSGWAQVIDRSVPGALNLRQVVIRAGVLIDGESNSPRRNQIITIRGNRITDVSDAASARIPDGAEVIDLSQATVLPGLIDAHTHIFLQGEDPAEG